MRDEKDTAADGYEAIVQEFFETFPEGAHFPVGHVDETPIQTFWRRRLAWRAQ